MTVFGQLIFSETECFIFFSELRLVRNWYSGHVQELSSILLLLLLLLLLLSLLLLLLLL